VKTRQIWEFLLLIGAFAAVMIFLNTVLPYRQLEDLADFMDGFAGRALLLGGGGALWASIPAANRMRVYGGLIVLFGLLSGIGWTVFHWL